MKITAKKFFLWIHQLPQNLVGFFMTRKPQEILLHRCNDDKSRMIYFTSNVFGCGVCLGDYIILDYNIYYKKMLYENHFFYETAFNNTVNHEAGHSVQSKYLGWLYFPVVGLPSLINNLIHRKFKKTEQWYYSRYPENWADKLGGVKR